MVSVWYDGHESFTTNERKIHPALRYIFNNCRLLFWLPSRDKSHPIHLCILSISRVPSSWKLCVSWMNWLMRKCGQQKAVPSNILNSPCWQAVEKILCLVNLGTISRHVQPSLIHLPLEKELASRGTCWTWSLQLPWWVDLLFPPLLPLGKGGRLPTGSWHSLLSSRNRFSPTGFGAREDQWILGSLGRFTGPHTKLFPPT